MSICTRLHVESSLPELARCARGARGADGARGKGSQSAAQTPPGHTRRGLGLRALNKLPPINKTAAQAVDREFVDIVCPLGLFWLPVDWLWDAFGLNLGPTWLPLGCPWAPWGPHGVRGGSLEGPWEVFGGAFGGSWGCLGVPWGAQGDFLKFVENWTPNSDQMCLFARACA